MKTAVKLLRIFGPVVLGVAAGFLAATPWTSRLSLSDEARLCGGAKNTVQAEVQLAAARDVWQHLPAFAETPELEQDTRPATLVVFSGRFDTSVHSYGLPDVPAFYDDVICVVQADDKLNLYYDVPRQGSRYGS